MCLTVGFCFQVWIGMLRYFTFFKAYNALILTLKVNSQTLIKNTWMHILLFRVHFPMFSDFLSALEWFSSVIRFVDGWFWDPFITNFEPLNRQLNACFHLWTVRYFFYWFTIETFIFSIFAGDDMFATFNMINGQSLMITSFSKFYSFSFIMLFIYVILSLSIAIIMDAWVKFTWRFPL